MPPQIMIPISPGELLDKITILQNKVKQLADPMKRQYANDELNALQLVRANTLSDSKRLNELEQMLFDVNVCLWWIEEDIRVRESRQDFGDQFIQLARSVYQTNDRRAQIKREINELLGTTLREVKSYV